MHKNLDKVGKIFTLKTTARDAPRPPTSYLRISGGIFHDCAVHDLDLIRFMTNEEPKTVYVVARVPKYFFQLAKSRFCVLAIFFRILIKN